MCTVCSSYVKKCGFCISDNCCLINFSGISIELKPYNRKNNNDLPEYGEIVYLNWLRKNSSHTHTVTILGIIWIYVGWKALCNHCERPQDPIQRFIHSSFFFFCDYCCYIFIFRLLLFYFFLLLLLEWIVSIPLTMSSIPNVLIEKFNRKRYLLYFRVCSSVWFLFQMPCGGGITRSHSHSYRR